MRHLRLLLLLTTFCTLGYMTIAPQVALAQNDSYDEISFDDDDDEPDAPVAIDPKKPSVAKFVVNDSEVKPSSGLNVTKDQKLNISVSQLRPNTYVTVAVFKAGVKVGSEQFKANQDGEIELEVTVPNKKIKGKAEVTYTAASGKKVVFETEVNVD